MKKPAELAQGGRDEPSVAGRKTKSPRGVPGGLVYSMALSSA
jgi:hypothetical protein